MISDDLREAIKNSGQTCYALAKQAGVDPAALRKFVDGKRGLSLDTFDPLAEVLGMALVKRGECAPTMEPPDYERLRLEDAAAMAFALFQRVGKMSLEQIHREQEEKRVHRG
jgi:transcriptional regulator with XRE-family HTH domain